MGVFRFRRFEVDDCGCGQKICSDSVLLGAWFFKAHRQVRSVLDIGTGSGVLALIAADLLPKANIQAVELEDFAFAAAQSNFERSAYSDRLNVRHGDFSRMDADGPYDLIVCNPPFFSTGAHAADASRAAARHEGSLNAVSLVLFAARNLASGGHLGLVSPADRESEIVYEGELAGLSLCRLTRVQTSPRKACTRILWDFCRGTSPVQTENLSLRDASGSYSAEYLSLVEDIYLYLG